jgi:hypothetical protein
VTEENKERNDEMIDKINEMKTVLQEGFGKMV